MNRGFWLSAACLVVAGLGCSSPARRHLTLDRPAEEIAEIRGLDAAYGLWGPEYHITFEGIDGRDLAGAIAGGLPEILDVLPGKHTLLCRWVTIGPRGGERVTGTDPVELEVQAGRAYQAHLFSENRVQRVRIEEVPSKEATVEREQKSAMDTLRDMGGNLDSTSGSRHEP